MSRPRHKVLQCLLAAAGLIVTDDLDAIEVHREVFTKKGGFIDIVIRCKGYVIAIENKVYHHLDNDLEDYWKTVKNRWSTYKPEQYISLILSLRREDYSDDRWKTVFYHDLVKQLSAVETSLDRSNLYHLYLKDFIRNINNHLIPSNMTKEQIEFLSQNEDAVEEISNLYKLSGSHIFDRRNKIFHSPVLADLKWEKSVYDYQLFLQKKLEGGFMKIICSLEISGFYVEVDKSSMYYIDLMPFLKQTGHSTTKETNVGLLIKEFAPIYHISDEAVSNYLLQLTKNIDEYLMRIAN